MIHRLIYNIKESIFDRWVDIGSILFYAETCVWRLYFDVCTNTILAINLLKLNKSQVSNGNLYE